MMKMQIEKKFPTNEQNNIHSSSYNENENRTSTIKNIYGLSQWNNIDMSLLNSLIEKDLVKVINIDFSKDESSIYCSPSLYIQKNV